MRRTIWAIWTLTACAMLAACAPGGASPATATPTPAPTASGTRVAFVSTLVPRPTDPPTATPAPTATPEPVPTRAVNTLTPLSPTPLRPTVGVRPTSTPGPFTGASTTTPMNGTREFVAPNVGFRLRYPEMWTAGPQGSTIFSFSPETGSTRYAGFLIEAVPNPMKTPEQDLRENLTTSGNDPRLDVTKQPYTVMIDGKPAFRADLKLSFSTSSGSSSARSTPTTTPAPALVYEGSLITLEYKGVNYRIGVLSREGDAMTLMLAEQVLASLRFA